MEISDLSIANNQGNFLANSIFNSDTLTRSVAVKRSEAINFDLKKKKS